MAKKAAKKPSPSRRRAAKPEPVKPHPDAARRAKMDAVHAGALSIIEKHRNPPPPPVRACERATVGDPTVTLKWKNNGEAVTSGEAALADDIRARTPTAIKTSLVEKWKDGELKVGDAVYYRGERYHIEWLPASWKAGSFAHLTDVRVVIDQPLPIKRTTVCVFADLLSKTPPEATDGLPVAGAPAPAPVTAKAAERRERAKAGINDVDDPVAKLLRAANTQDEMYAAAAKFLGVPAAELRAKYGHLNPGQQRMNCGNRMRAKWKKEQGA